jgi:hypothetical protein
MVLVRDGRCGSCRRLVSSARIITAETESGWLKACHPKDRQKKDADFGAISVRLRFL